MAARMIVFVAATLMLLAAAQDEEAIICDGASGELKCAQGSVLQIVSATWGRDDRVTCYQGGAVKVCGSDVSTKVGSNCNGRQSCTQTTAGMNDGGDPCADVKKFIRIAFQCVPNEEIGTLRKCASEHKDDWTSKAHIVQISPAKCVRKCKELSPSFNGNYCVNKNINYCLCGDSGHPEALQPPTGGCIFNCGGAECGGPDGQYSCFALPAPPAPVEQPVAVPVDSYTNQELLMDNAEKN
jgi:hypothetical protein